ncbi:MAG TPA: hypothetical protein VEC16_03090 [Alphaproteobacteria bacterium]|nr:hypothetical protein [Alphaproteobacteria bacterium]
MNISYLINHSEKYNFPFHVFVVTDLWHERVKQFSTGTEEFNFIIPKIVYDTPRPYQFEQVKQTLKPIRGIIELYDDDPIVDCCDLSNNQNFPIRTKNPEQNLYNFLEIKKLESSLMSKMIESLAERKIIQKLCDKNIEYHIHKIYNVKPPEELSILNKQYDLYSQSYLSVPAATTLALSSLNNEDIEEELIRDT